MAEGSAAMLVAMQEEAMAEGSAATLVAMQEEVKAEEVEATVAGTALCGAEAVAMVEGSVEAWVVAETMVARNYSASVIHQGLIPLHWK